MTKPINQNKEIAALYRINKFLACVEDLDKLLKVIMQEASSTVKAEASSIALYDNRQKNLRFMVSLGKKGAQVKEARLKLGEGIIGYAAQSRKPINIADAAKDKRFHTGIDEKTKFKSRTILAVPIVYKQRLVGALEVINKKGAAKFSSADIKLLEIVAGVAAIAIEDASLYQRLLRKHNALKTKHNRMIEMQKKMLLMERMSAIGDTASRMVHDLRNPLALIRGCAELLNNNALEAKERKKWANVIEDEVDRLTGMTTEVMDFAKGKTNLFFQNYPLDDFIREIAAYLERDFQPYNIKLIVELNYKGIVYMDKPKMQRAIFNLSFNARDVMLKGGIFKIETNFKDSMVEIKLMDTGPGIPQEIKDKLGEPFATFGKVHGTGLGIAIVKKIITEVHKGIFSVDSRPPEEGAFTTTFILKIPVK